MYNLEEESDKIFGSENTIPLQNLDNLDDLGFKLIPLRQDSKTPNVSSTNDVYHHPEYWTKESLRKNHHLFQGVATVLGKSRVKDESGKDLYLNAIDIDSDKVFTRLARVANRQQVKRWQRCLSSR